MIHSEHTPRFSFEITEATRYRIAHTALSQFGLRKAVFNIILDDLLTILETSGPAAIGFLLNRKLRPSDILQSMHDAREEVKNG
jgi:hypothetical protein